MSAPTLDPRVFKHLMATGVITTDRVTRRPTTRACRTCHTPVIAAIESSGTSEPACRIELTPAFLTPLGELQAVMANVGTFEYEPTAIWWRHPHRLAAHPANTVPVMAEHKCNNPPFQTGANPAPKNARPKIPTQCPF